MEEYVLKNREDDGIVAILINGNSPHSGKTKEEFLAEGNIVLLKDEAWKLITQNEEIKYIKPWEETTEEHWDDMLNCLPPMRYKRIGNACFFFNSEAYTSNIHSCFCKIGDMYFFAKRRTTQTYESMLEEMRGQGLISIVSE